MTAVVGRIVYGVAALLLVVSLLGLRAATRDVFHYPVELPNGGPALVYEPGSERGWGEPPRPGTQFPVVVLAHGFASNAGAVSTLARHLARAGYAVITPEFRGHGRNREPFLYRTADVAPGLVDDIGAAVLFARTEPHLDGTRIAVAGHSMGGHAALAYGGQDPSLAAVIGIAGGAYPKGPYDAPNVLLIWGSRDSSRRHIRFREVGAELAGRERLVLDRTYGDAARGGAVRLSEVAGADHFTVIYSRETARRILAWLETTLGAGVGRARAPGSDGRYVWCGLGLLAQIVLLWGLVRALAPLLPHGTLRQIRRPLRALGLLFAALLVTLLGLAGIDPQGSRGPLGFVPLVGGRDLIAFLGLVGTGLCVWLALLERIKWVALRDLRTYVGAGVLVGFGYLTLGSFSQAFWDLWLTPQRLPWGIVSGLLLLPYFGALEWLLRGPGRTGVWLPILGKLLTLAILVSGALLGLLPHVLVLSIVTLVPAFLVFELFAYRLSRETGEPWLAALFQAAWLGLVLASIFPLDA
jgi:pimeloyl-ACP methyl ester carboxylesterase